MSIESDLKKDGIIVIKKLDTLKINSIAKNISKKLCDTFPDFGINQNELFIKLSRLDIYIAKCLKVCLKPIIFTKIHLYILMNT